MIRNTVERERRGLRIYLQSISSLSHVCPTPFKNSINNIYLSRFPLLHPLYSANEYGLFKPDEDPTKGRWLEQGRILEYYHLKSGVCHTNSSKRAT